ncbi:recombinase family protein [Priestia filamentosa]|uniref:recombinase family protein n=1 Tax=Priestia filamentosa TaxID=1402861 RepID=UPI000A084984|nr:recombinase family protein [Priestia filamentosa]OXS67955.1 recombinase family protein [Priestia filamentosa]OXS67956.1 recombinase family protein [Priestia filamentosa]SMF46340.1 Site-specific DNA recombinase [Priestia filamentosa]SMF46354.1 Site-specific DNA recombinase [Priestia filamentosa]
MTIRHVAIYLRISRDKKEGIDTLSNHRDILIDFCRSSHWTYERYEEIVSGGGSELENRPELYRLLNDIDLFDGILVFELSRLSRNGLVSQQIKQVCIDYDKKIITPYQIYDLANNHNDRLLYDFGSVIASQEHALIGKRSKTNKKIMAKSGLHVSGSVPFGYVRNPHTKKLEIHQEQAEIVKLIFQLHAKGYGSFSIRNILNERGYRTAKGGYFELPTIKRIIRNPAYKGTNVFNDRKKVKEKDRFIYKIVETIQVPNAWDPIIPPEEWEKANADRKKRADHAETTREKAANKTGVTLLKDLLYCGVCGKKMTIRKDKGSKYMLKRCEYLLPSGEKCPNRGVMLKYVEEDVVEHIKQYKDEIISILYSLKLEEWSGTEKDYNNHLEQIEKEIRRIRTEEENLLNLAIKGLFSEEQILTKRQELLNTLHTFTAQKEAIIDELTNLKKLDTKERLQTAVEGIHGLEIVLENDMSEEANRSMKRIIHKIYYKRVLPEDLLKKSTRNKERKLYPFTLNIHYK